MRYITFALQQNLQFRSEVLPDLLPSRSEPGQEALGDGESFEAVFEATG